MKQTMTDSDSTEQQLRDAIAQLPQEMTPERDLWSGIEKAISQKSQSAVDEKKKVFMPAAWAASVVAAVLLTWVTLGPQQDGAEQSVNIVAEMQNDFEQQKQTMLVSFGTPNVSELPEAMQAELAKLSSAQKTISKALVDEPNNSDLLNLLRWTQKQELDLLKQLYSPQWQTI